MVTDRKWLSGHLLTYLLTDYHTPNLEMLSHLKIATYLVSDLF